MFYTFGQTNSGGRFINDEKVGHFVIIEAESKQHAIDKAESIGLYWDGVEDGYDCPCCGDRWYPGADEYDTPTIFGEPFDTYEDLFDAGVHVYYADGRHVRIVGSRSD